MLTAVMTMSLIALLGGAALGLAYGSLPSRPEGLVDRVNGLLPQTQCAQCGYAGCRPYARAIVEHQEAINLCPPGGEALVRRLAGLLARDAVAGPTASPARVVAQIDESRCIGCAHCLAACPVDAIVGAPHYLHTVIEAECTGCELCVAPCPVDCISLRVA